MVFVGVHPSLIHVPPTCSRSTIAVRIPAPANVRHNGVPPCPEPMTIASKLFEPTEAIASPQQNHQDRILGLCSGGFIPLLFLCTDVTTAPRCRAHLALSMTRFFRPICYLPYPK